MEWDKAIAECPSNYNGRCMVSAGNRLCADNVRAKKCPIVKLGIMSEKFESFYYQEVL